ncbi:MAG: transposase, partial [Syntrophobacterales bacterium]
MARSVRMNYPDTFYHVLSRGNDKRDIFRSKDDYEKFKETIGRMVGRYDMEVHGYVLMSNHYHLLIRTRQANLSRAIQWLGLTYSMWF